MKFKELNLKLIGGLIEGKKSNGEIENKRKGIRKKNRSRK